VQVLAMIEGVHHRCQPLAQEDDGEQAKALGQVLGVRGHGRCIPSHHPRWHQVERQGQAPASPTQRSRQANARQP